jgi:hypothetical protein
MPTVTPKVPMSKDEEEVRTVIEATSKAHWDKDVTAIGARMHPRSSVTISHLRWFIAVSMRKKNNTRSTPGRDRLKLCRALKHRISRGDSHRATDSSSQSGFA